ncbi:hypothetical protein L3X38_006124 [Prunus dulcis]|uniref:Transmembrane protein n=1 Tax=Prunus dulcis TaxID=3755 RepID=A0AAD4ZS75_PRUDU|nr:hypothetical protein L3X38_006124 [Prunus dulcis]
MTRLLVATSLCFFFFFLVLGSGSCLSALTRNGLRPTRDTLKFSLVDENLGSWRNGISEETAQSPGPASDAPQGTLVLAAKRTNRPDILSRFKRYRGGWDIANRHYWASVGFTVFTCAAAIGSNTLTEKTSENSVKVKRVFSAVRSALITVAAVMLLLAVIGLFLSILGNQHAIHIFIVSGWLLVAITFILSGVFVILNNTVSDTCMAMEEWLRDSQCGDQEVSISNASLVWQNYTCEVSVSECAPQLEG